MKFLLFNLVVAGSLYYLFNAGDLTSPVLQNQAQASVAQVSQSLATTSEVKIEKTKAVPDSRISSAPAGDLLEENPTPIKEKVAVSEKVAVNKPAVVIPVTKPKTTPAPALAPDVAQRRAEVLGELPVTSVPIASNPVLMSPSIRRQELHALAEEMEYRSLGWRID